MKPDSQRQPEYFLRVFVYLCFFFTFFFWNTPAFWFMVTQRWQFFWASSTEFSACYSTWVMSSKTISQNEKKRHRSEKWASLSSVKFQFYFKCDLFRNLFKNKFKKCCLQVNFLTKLKMLGHKVYSLRILSTEMCIVKKFSHLCFVKFQMSA